MTDFNGVVISDLHSMSRYAPLPQNFNQEDGQPLGQNSLQKALFNKFAAIAKEPNWHKPDMLVWLGDACQGVMGKRMIEAGTGISSPFPMDQVKAAVELAELFDPKEHVVITGTEAHGLVDGITLEEHFARGIDATKIGDGSYRTNLKFILDVGDFTCHFAHHAPTSQTEWFLSTPLSKEGIRLQLQHRRIGHIDAIFRGHNHYWTGIDYRSQYLISCPTWQVAPPFMHRKSGEPLTDIGAVRFRITKEPDEFGTRFRYEKRLIQVQEANTKVLKR